MKPSRRAFPALFVLVLVSAAAAAAQEPAKRYVPKEGQPGKDVVWVPTPDEMVEKMLDIAEVTADDHVIDLGSGDGRNVIAAAKRGATAVGVEYEDKLVGLARELAAEAGVADKATFVQGDMYEADISRASVLVLFLLNENLNRLAPKFLALAPGTRMVVNTFRVDGWEPDYTETFGNCFAWCTVHLYIVPARVEGTWRAGEDTLRLWQEFQMVSGILERSGKRLRIQDGRLRGDRIEFTAGGVRYEGRVNGDRIDGQIAAAAGAPGGDWSATRR